MMRVRVLRTLALPVALAIVGAACTDEDLSPARDQKRSASEICRDDPFGCVQVDQGKPIRLAALVPYPDSEIGLGPVSRAMSLAIEDRRPLLGRDVVLTRRSDGCGHYTPLDNLASDPTMVAVIGAGCSSTHELAKEILSEKGVVFLSTSSSGPSLTTPTDYTSFFLRTMYNDRIQGSAMAAFAKERLVTRTAATVHDGSPYGESLVADFASDFLSGGGEVLVQRELRQGDQDFGRIVGGIEKRGPDFLYAPIFVAEAALLTQQVRQTQGMKHTSYGGADGMFTRDWLDATGPEAEDAYVSAPDHRFWDPRLDSEFMPRFERRFGESTNAWPGFLARAYDATNMVLDAIEDVALEARRTGTLYIPRTRLRDRMFATKGYPGLSGTLTCDPNGDCNHSTRVVIYQVRNGAFRKAWTWDPTA